MSHSIELDDEAYDAFRHVMKKYGLGSASDLVRRLTAVHMKSKPDPEKPKLVVADALYGPGPDHSHRCWGADCPVCRQYFWEDIDTMPLPVEERPTECDYCEQKIKLIYPWELGEAIEEEKKREPGRNQGA